MIETFVNAKLESIDKLRSLGVSSTISLPQVIVVGDQSSGKSSLLESISGITFPRSEGMCTTFVTQVILTPGPKHEIKATFQGVTETLECKPQSNGSTASPKGKAGAASNANSSSASSTILLAEYIDKIKKQLGGKVVEDIMTIEVTGPSLPRLTLVDIPGYIHSTVAGQDETVVDIIERRADAFIKEERSIVLAVCASNRDFQTNYVTKKIKKYDPEGARTMCVFTKADLATEANVKECIEFMKNVNFTLRHGYHVVINNGKGNDHEILGSLGWREAPSEDRGVNELRRKLVTLLNDHVNAKFPEVVEEIQRKLREQREAVRTLGFDLSDASSKQYEYQKCVSKFMQAWQDKIEGRRDVKQADRSETMRATLWRNYNTMYMKCDEQTKKVISVEDMKMLLVKNRTITLPGFGSYSLFVEAVYDQIAQMISEIHAASTQCVELVYANLQATAKTNFRQEFVQHALGVIGTKVEQFREKIQCQIQELQEDEISPITVNHYFSDQISKKMSADAIDRAQARFISGSTYSGSSFHNALADIKTAVSNDEFEAKLMIAITESYLKTAFKRIVDCSCLNIIERTLFRHGKEEIRDSLIRLNISEVNEPVETRQKRKRLQHEIDQLSEGLKMVCE